MTTHFTLDIRLGNALMRDGDDIGTALRAVADDWRLEGAVILDEDNEVVSTPHGLILDLNGSQVGHWQVTERDVEPEAVARIVLDNHAIRPDWKRTGEQMISLIAEAIRLDRGEV